MVFFTGIQKEHMGQIMEKQSMGIHADTSYAHTYMQIFIHPCIHLCIHTCINTFVYMYIYIYISRMDHPSGPPVCALLACQPSNGTNSDLPLKETFPFSDPILKCRLRWNHTFGKMKFRKLR